jgi:hypothetical protein
MECRTGEWFFLPASYPLPVSSITFYMDDGSFFAFLCLFFVSTGAPIYNAPIILLPEKDKEPSPENTPRLQLENRHQIENR